MDEFLPRRAGGIGGRGGRDRNTGADDRGRPGTEGRGRGTRRGFPFPSVYGDGKARSDESLGARSRSAGVYGLTTRS